MHLALDHVLIIQDDLKGAREAADRLGFSTTPTGFHGQGLGTANATVMMPDRRTYFELIAVTEPTPRNADKREALAAHGPHLFGIAFRGEAREAAARFAALAVGDGDAFDFVRPVDLPQGPQDARFAVAQMFGGTLPGLSAFVCQHFTPDAVWRHDCLEHPNGARAVAGVWGVAADPGSLAQRWRPLFGEAVSATDDVLEIALGQTRVRYLSPRRWEADFGEAPDREDPHLEAVEIAVASAGRLEAALSATGTGWDEVAGFRRVRDVYGLGTTVLFTAP
jgi:hypothetical protein